MAPSYTHPIKLSADSRPHLVIVGAGFGGLAAARALRRADVRVTIVDRQNHHLFQPLLYQVATAGLSGAEIAEPIRDVLRHQKNVTVLLGEVNAIDVDRRTVTLDDEELRWDGLIVAAGARNHWFGRNDWAGLAPGLKTLRDAFGIRDRVLLAYERAEREENEADRRRLLTFAVIGAGPTGVEMAGALAEIACRTMARNFRRFNPADARVLLIEGGKRVLPEYHPNLSERALRDLRKLGVEVRLESTVEEIDARGLTVAGERIEAATVLWAAGVRPSPLAKLLPAEKAPDGRVRVGPDLSIASHPNVFVVGDMAAVARDPKPADEGVVAERLVPGVAPAAEQMGRHAARQWLARIRGEATKPFRYLDKGSMATIGRSKAVLQSGPIRMAGLPAWLAWVFVHLMALVGFRNRLLVFLDWMLAYFSNRRGARVVTGVASTPPERRASKHFEERAGEEAESAAAGPVEAGPAEAPTG